MMNEKEQVFQSSFLPFPDSFQPFIHSQIVYFVDITACKTDESRRSGEPLMQQISSACSIGYQICNVVALE